MATRILIAGGGTGGHVYPALAIIDSLKSLQPVELLYIGGKGGVENEIVPRYGLPMKTIWISGFARSLSLKNLLFPLKVVVSLVQSLIILRRFRPAVAVGCGGYVTGPILWMAARLGIPVLIQEQDVHPGVTSKLLAGSANTICLSFEAASQHFSANREKLVVAGNPVRAEVNRGDRVASLRQWQLDPQKLTLFVFGGSQGSRAINLAMAGIWKDLRDKHAVQLIWQSGPGQFADVEKRMDNRSDMVLLPYVEDMAAAYAAADIIICRAGASSLAELAMVGKAAVLVPYPHAAGDHQARNAQTMAEAGAALMVREGDGWEPKLKIAIEKLIENEALRRKQGESWAEMAKPEAGRTIAAEIIKLSEHGTGR